MNQRPPTAAQPLLRKLSRSVGSGSRGASGFLEVCCLLSISPSAQFCSCRQPFVVSQLSCTSTKIFQNSVILKHFLQCSQCAAPQSAVPLPRAETTIGSSRAGSVRISDLSAASREAGTESLAEFDEGSRPTCEAPVAEFHGVSQCSRFRPTPPIGCNSLPSAGVPFP